VFRTVGETLAVLAVTLVGTMPVIGGDEFPIVGVYTKDQVCKGDGSDPADLMVRITDKSIESSMGRCTILSKTRSGKSISVQLECTTPANQVMLGDVTFTQRDGNDNALDFDDQYHTSPATLYKCASGLSSR